MEKKILIVGAGKVGTAQLKQIIQATGHNESECIIVENQSEIMQLAKDLVSLNTKEVNQLLELDKIESIAYCSSQKEYVNIQKQNSQCGWKNRPKHKR